MAMPQALRRFWSNEVGADATEYALLAALVALAIVSGMSTLGASMSRMIEVVAESVPTYPGD